MHGTIAAAIGERTMATQVIDGPRKRGFLCLNAHPAGCAANVAEQIKIASELNGSLNNVLVIGSSTGYGLASAIRRLLWPRR